MTQAIHSLADAIAFAEAHESPFPRDLRAHLESGYFEAAPDNAMIGPIFPRGGPNGLILQEGTRLGSWGDTRQADMTFSVAKSYLSLLAGVAEADGLIPDLDAPVRDHHLAPSADQHFGMGGRAVRQVRPHRPWPRPVAGGHRQARRAGAPGPRHLLGIQ